MKELWKPIKDYKGFYEVSNLGRVKALERVVILKEGKKKYVAERILKLTQTFQSKNYTNKKIHYLKIQLKGRFISIHRLVAEAFIPNPENKLQVNHIDGNRLNNKVENLEWVTPSENMLHAHSKSTHLYSLN